MSRNSFQLEPHELPVVGKAGFIWCHGTHNIESKRRCCYSWKSRFYLMSRNSVFIFCFLIPQKILLEKPVLFDVTELIFIEFILLNVGKAGFIWCHGTYSVWFLIHESHVGKAGFIWCHGTYVKVQVNIIIISWKSRFYLMSRNWFCYSFCRKFGSWKSRFYLMSRNTLRWVKVINFYVVGKAGFIWCHGTGK